MYGRPSVRPVHAVRTEAARRLHEILRVPRDEISEEADLHAPRVAAVDLVIEKHLIRNQKRVCLILWWE